MARAGGILAVDSPILCLPPATGDLPEQGGIVVCSPATPYRKPIEHAGHSYQQQLIRTFALDHHSHIVPDGTEVGIDGKQRKPKSKKSDAEMRAESSDAAKTLASKMAVGSDDLYELLELGDKRWHATADDIKKSFRRISLIYHPDKISHHGDEAKNNAEAHFKAVMKAYDILSDKKRRAAYDSIDDVDDSIPSEKDATSTPQRFYEKFSACFALNARWSVSDRVPELGGDDAPMDNVHKFYDFWYSFKSWRDFSFDTEYDLDQAECREEKRWMERQNAKHVKTKKLEENARIRRLVDLAYKHDPRIVREKQAVKAKKDAAKEKRKKQAEQATRLAKETEEKKKKEAEEKAELDKIKRVAAKKQKDAARMKLRKSRQKLRAAGRELGIMDTERGLIAVEDMCTKGCTESIEAVAIVLASIPDSVEDKIEYTYEVLTRACESPLEPVSTTFEMNGSANHQENGSASISNVKESPSDSDAQASSSAKQPPLTNGVPERKKPSDVQWSQEELSALSRGVAKFPGGTRDRWIKLSELIGTKTADEVLRKVNESRPSKIKAGSSKQVAKPESNSESNAFERFQEKKKGKPVVPQGSEANGSVPSSSAPPNRLHFTPKQQSVLEANMKKFPASEGAARWRKISEIVGRTADDCEERFKELIQYYKAKNAAR